MPSQFAPDTPDILTAIVAYQQNMLLTDGVTPAYTTGGVSEGENKDITDLVANGGASCEVYCNLDGSERYTFGGYIQDTQSFFVLSLVSLDNAQAAEIQIAKIRDANMLNYEAHATLGGAANIISARIKPGSGRFLKVPRNSNRWYRAYVVELEVVSGWYVTGGVQS